MSNVIFRTLFFIFLFRNAVAVAPEVAAMAGSKAEVSADSADSRSVRIVARSVAETAARSLPTGNLAVASAAALPATPALL